MSDALTDVLFWSQVLIDDERTVVCSPENESRCKSYVAARGLDGQITVLASPAVRDDQLLIFDTHALDASLAQMTQRAMREWPRYSVTEHRREFWSWAATPPDFRITGAER